MDIYIKDEGDEFSTVIFQSEKAKELFYKTVELEEHPNKVDVPNLELHKILTWAVSHNLTVESEVSIIVPSKN